MTSDTKEHGEARYSCYVEGCPADHLSKYAACIEPHQLLRPRPTPARMELPQGVKRVDELRLREIMSGYMEFHAPDYFEIRALAYEVRNWRRLAAVNDAALEAAAKGKP